MWCIASGVNSNGSSFTVVSAPSITSLSITKGAVGAPVTITGTNFGATQGSGTVKFNGTTATVTSLERDEYCNDGAEPERIAHLRRSARSRTCSTVVFQDA